MRFGSMLFVLAAACCSSVRAAAPATTQSSGVAPIIYQSEYDWYRRNCVEAYEKFGRHDPRWDAAARRMLTAYAHLHSQEMLPIGGDDDDEILDARSTTLKYKCDDPLVLHITGRAMAYWHRKQEDITDYTLRAAEGLRKSEYHPVFKCYALLRAAECKAIAKESIPESLQQARQFLDDAVAQIPAVLDDPKLPRVVLFNLIDSVGDASELVTRDREMYAARAFKIVDEKCKDRSLVLTISARFHAAHGWDARGGGFADNVSDEQFKTMAKRLVLAAEAGEAAFELDPKNVLAPLVMLRVELGQGEGRARMEQWFARAVAADPNCYEAYWRKLLYLEPKWYGSVKEMIGFARQSANKANWNAGTPLILIEAHLDASRYTADGYQPKPQPAYFKDPRVWNDVKRVYDEYLKRFPESLYHRSRYAQIACWAEQWQEADKQFKTMGDKFSFAYFRNRSVYQRVRAELETKLNAAAGR